MSIKDGFKEEAGSEMEVLFQELDDTLDEYFSERGERRRFMGACRRLSYQDLSIIERALSGADISDSYAGLALKLEAPIRSANAILMLETYLKKTKNINCLQFLLSVIKRDKVVKALNRLRFLSWEIPLLGNKKLPGEFIDFLWASNKNEAYKHVLSYDTLRVISKLPNCPVNVLKDLYHFYEDSDYDDDSVIRGAIARHRNIDDDLINRYINSNRKSERVELARSKYIPQEALLSLMKDKYDEVSDLAKEQFFKRFPDITITNALIDQAISKRVKNPYKKPTSPKRVFDKYEDAKMGVAHIKSLNPSQRAAVIGLVDEETFFELINDSSKAVKRAIALSRLTPIDKLREYVQEQDLCIASNAFQAICDRESSVAFEDVFQSKGIEESYELLNKFLNDKKSFEYSFKKRKATEEIELQRIYLVAKYSSNSFIQTKIVNGLDEIPNSGSVRWMLLSHLVDNKALCDNVVWKFYMELGFGGERALQHCKSKQLFEKIIATNNPPSRNYNPKVVQSFYQKILEGHESG